MQRLNSVFNLLIALGLLVLAYWFTRFPISLVGLFYLDAGLMSDGPMGPIFWLIIIMIVSLVVFALAGISHALGYRMSNLTQRIFELIIVVWVFYSLFQMLGYEKPETLSSNGMEIMIINTLGYVFVPKVVFYVLFPFILKQKGK